MVFSAENPLPSDFSVNQSVVERSESKDGTDSERNPIVETANQQMANLHHGSFITKWLEIKGLSLRDLVGLVNHNQDRGLLAWQNVKFARNPFFAEGTGFEGYDFGLVQSSAEELENLISDGQGILDSIARLHRNDRQYINVLINTLYGDQHEPRAINEWTDILGALLAKKRAKLINNPVGEKFRTETHTIVGALPKVQWHHSGDNIIKSFSLGQSVDVTGKPKLESYDLTSKQEEALAVMMLLGEYGDPLIRLFSEIDRSGSGHRLSVHTNFRG